MNSICAIIEDFSHSGDTFMYADDTTVFCISSSQDAACSLLNCALKELSLGVLSTA